jgi:hypothetical protein
VITELIVGFMIPGKPNAMMMCVLPLWFWFWFMGDADRWLWYVVRSFKVIIFYFYVNTNAHGF